VRLEASLMPHVATIDVFIMGIWIALLASGFSTGKDLVSKRLTLSLDGTASTFASFAFALPFYLLLLAGAYLAVPAAVVFGSAGLLMVLLRALTDSMAELCKMHALAKGEISQISSLMHLSPVFLLLLSPFITGDRASPPGIFGVCLSVIGTWMLVAKPSKKEPGKKEPSKKEPGKKEPGKKEPGKKEPGEKTSAEESIPLADKTTSDASATNDSAKGVGTLFARFPASALALGAAFFFALNTSLDRLAVRSLGPIWSGFLMTLCSAALLAPWVLPQQHRRTDMRAAAKPLLVRGLLEVSYMVLKLWSLTYLAPAYSAGIQRLSLPMSVLGGYLFFGERDIKRRLFASAIIGAGAVCIILSR
jgi:drug/metabolite transporter (DMT)-like permease